MIKGIEMFGLDKLGDKAEDNISKFVINFYFYWKNILGLFEWFYLASFNFLLSQRAATYIASAINFISNKEAPEMAS